MKLALVVVVSVAAPSFAQGKQPVDLAAELRAIAAKTPKKDISGSAPAAAKGCTTPTKAERADVRKRALAYIDAKHPDEVGADGSNKDMADLEINVGCKEPSGAIIMDVSQDRDPKKSGRDTYGTRRNYLFRVWPKTIDVLAEDTSTKMMDWMEWADEGRISLLAQFDVDRDGALDVVYSDHEHEGGSMSSDDFIHVLFANGTRGESAQIQNLFDVRVVKDQLVVAGQTRDEETFYGCIGRDLHVSPCAAGAALQTAADRAEILGRYGSMTAADIPDRERLEKELALLGTRARERARLVAAAPETSATDHVQRKVVAFLVKAKLIEPPPMPSIVTQTRADARAYLDDLAAKLGDTPCAATPLTDADKAKATAWVRRQDAKASDVIIEPSACGAYMWIGWMGDSDDSRFREVLLGRDGTTRVLGFTYERDMPSSGLGHSEKWFMHGGTIIGIAIGSSNLWVIADGKAVAQTKGDQLAFYRYDERWGETSNDVFVDGGTLWHATPTGREKLDMSLVRDHETRRAAVALLQRDPPSGNAKYIAALQLLGADRALIAECKKLP